ncbi:hypothetical protein [Aestuariibacter sp. GS-14]|uniref:hypothetical protein n=1 Tax=Aestuariibacter sp. GS-14 TaxID=2590670 RepID=UPI0021063B6E|nr:hypothetical protein [Aestuariibacter sp. GS-14]
MIRCFVLCCGLFIAIFAHAAKPDFFTDEMDSEYRALLKHIDTLLPQTDLPLAYLPSFTPFNLLEIRPTKFTRNEDKQAFSNFSFGVFGSRMLNVTREQLSQLPALTICKKQDCTQERIDYIKRFIADSADDIALLRQNAQVFIVQQTAPEVFRVNNTFYSPTQLITYYPSEKAGFVPSANFHMTSPNEAPDLLLLANTTVQLREMMASHKVAAIAKINEQSINIVFGGIADNHWGAVLFHSTAIPASGDYNHLGLQYDIVHKISDNSFYYQTN